MAVHRKVDKKGVQPWGEDSARSMAWQSLDELVEQAKDLAAKQGENWDEDLEKIIGFCYRTNDGALPQDRKGLKRYVSKFYKARNGVIQPKELQTKADRAVDWVLQAFYGVSEADCSANSVVHRRSMQAENIIGALLERYLATELRQQGWVWCCGSTAEHIDFIHPSSDQALQVKNRDNSENAASKSVRAGTEIQHWFRIKSRTGDTMWHQLPVSPDTFSEDGFRNFIKRYAAEVVPESER